jgi:16S rRNA (uracil1498-N3)-methyltransferase
MSQPKHRIFLRPARVHLNDDPPWADIDSDNIHHLRQVLRLGPGAGIRIFDGSGREYKAEITDSRPRRMRARILGSENPETESWLKITLAQALIRENNFDRILTSCTELGCSYFIPLITARTRVSIGRKADLSGKMKRWDKILERASAQSGRVKVPRIDIPVNFEEFLEEDRTGLKLVLTTRTRGADLSRLFSKDDLPEEIVIISGPEGGFEDEEENIAIDSGCHPVSLGPRILRAETAPPAAIILIQYLAGDIKG